MSMDDLITVLLVCAGISLALNVLLKKVQVESLIGYILTGVIVGNLLGLRHSESLDTIAEFGVVFLMFTIGVEFAPDKLRLMKREVFLFGPLQVLITGSLFFLIGHFVLDLDPAVNLVICLALSLSSTAIVLNLLTRSRRISRKYGRNSVGILLFQDLLVIPILLMVSILSRSQQSIPGLLLEVVLEAAFVTLALFLGGRILTPFVLQHVIGTRSNELFVGSILLFVVGSAQIAQTLGLSHSLGAFLAGLVISETHYRHQVVADMTPFRDLLLGVFFITVGIQVDPLFLASNLSVILGLAAGLLCIKSVTIFLIMRVFSGTRTSIKTALLLSQCGEFSFVVFETAQVNRLFVDFNQGQLLIVAVVTTMMLTPFIFRYLDVIAVRMGGEPETQPGDDAEQPAIGVDEQHVVICGFGVFGQRVATRLEAKGVPYVAIEHDGKSFRASRDRNLPVYFGNATRREFLERIDIEHARAVMIAMSNEARILLVAQSVRSVAPDVPILVCVTNPVLAKELVGIGVSTPVDSVDEAAQALIKELLQLEFDRNDPSSE